MIRRPIFNARSRASELTRTASSTCAGVAVVRSITLLQLIVADEGDAVEIDLLTGSRAAATGIAARLLQDGRAQQADQQRARDRRSDRGSEILRRAAQRADVARKLLGRGRDQHVEQQRDQRSLPDAEQRSSPIRTGTALQSLRTTKASHNSADRANNEAVAADLPRRQPSVELARSASR